MTPDAKSTPEGADSRSYLMHDQYTCATCSVRVPEVVLRARRIAHHGVYSTEAKRLLTGGARRIADWGES